MRKGNWFQTFSGGRFWPLDPRPEDFCLLDIAHALSNICRFNGHVTRFYSVAQHSVLVSHLVPPELALEGLMHDAAEAYLADIARPTKQHLPEYQKIERAIERALAIRYGLRYEEGWPEEVKEADDRMLMTERRDVLVYQIDGWGIDAEPIAETITPETPDRAFGRFVARFAAASEARIGA